MWNGSCIVHEQFSEKEVVKLKARHKNAFVIAHPECPETLLRHADHIGSTSSLLKFTENNAGSEFIVLTESGIIHQMKKISPNSQFYDVPSIDTEEGSCASCNNCPYMRLNTIEKLYMCLVNEAPFMELSEATRLEAAQSLTKMLEMSPKK
jgi:quinolinate synthase